jgi:hypothetical protein
VTFSQAGADATDIEGKAAAVAMLTEQYDYVIGGDPDRDSVDLAVIDTATGQVIAHLADRADGAGYARMLAWANRYAPVPGYGRWKAPAASPPDWPRS